MLKKTLFSLRNQHLLRSRRPLFCLPLAQFSVKSKDQSIEDFDILMQSLNSKVLAEELTSQPVKEVVEDTSSPYIYQQNGNVVHIRGDQDLNLKQNQLININGSTKALVIALQDKQTVAMLLNDDEQVGNIQLDTIQEKSDFKVELGFGEVLTSNQGVSQQYQGQTSIIDYSNLKLDKAPYKRQLVKEQIFTGHLRIDMADPMTKGNFIVLKGDKRASGKHLVIQGAVESFLKESQDHQVIHVCLSKNKAQQFLSKIDEEDKGRVAVISAESNETEQYLAPQFGLKFMQQLVQKQETKPKFLFVFEDIVAHEFKEKFIFDKANQPFSPIKILNEIMENTGIFDNFEMTSMVSLDTQSTSMLMEIDQMNFEKNLYSIADQIVDFNSEDCRLTKGFMPQMGLMFTPKPCNGWQSIYLRKHVSTSFRNLLQKIDTSQRDYYTKLEFQLDQDPWENYLFHDTKLLIPLVCHPKALKISEQVILAKFIQHSIEEETISQYTIQGMQILDELLKFAGQFEISKQSPVHSGDQSDDDIIDSDDESPKTSGSTLFSRIDTLISMKSENKINLDAANKLEQDIERMLKMFYLQMKVQGTLKEYRDDYFV